MDLGRAANLSGRAFGRLTAVQRIDNNEFRQTMWLCLCNCQSGRQIKVRAADLVGGRTTSCGCIRTAIRVNYFRKFNDFKF